MTTFSQNLKVLRMKSGLKQSEIADFVGVTVATWSNYEVGRSEPNLESLTKIAKHLNITVDSLIGTDIAIIAKNLIKGKLNYKKGSTDFDENSKENRNETGKLMEESREIYKIPKVVTVDQSGRDNIIFVPLRARAGYLSGYEDPDFIQTLPTYRIPGLNHGTFRMFEAYGHSMVPTFHESDHIVGRFVENFNEIRDNRVYIVVTKREGIVLKRVINRLSRDSKLILNSDNQRHSGEYPPIIINPEDVLEIWYAVLYMSRQMREPGEIYNRLIDVESRLTILEQARKKTLE